MRAGQAPAAPPPRAASEPASGVDDVVIQPMPPVEGTRFFGEQLIHHYLRARRFRLPRAAAEGSMAGMRIPVFRSAAVLLLLAAPASAQSYRGEATAIDGRTILLSAMGHRDVTARILGIDAPGLDAAGGDGWFARAALDDILAGAGGTLTCQHHGDEQGRPLVHCMLDGGEQRDIGLAMVASGWAVPLRPYLRANAGRLGGDLAASYDRAERAARRARKGRWARMPGK